MMLDSKKQTTTWTPLSLQNTLSNDLNLPRYPIYSLHSLVTFADSCHLHPLTISWNLFNGFTPTEPLETSLTWGIFDKK